jgi:hypothetical protein
LHRYRHARSQLCQNVVALKEVILEDKSIYMVFEYAEHDFLVRRPRLLLSDSHLHPRRADQRTVPPA